jgi:hypothetical protein
MVRMARAAPPRRAGQSFEDNLEGQVVRPVLDEGRSVGAVARTST